MDIRLEKRTDYKEVEHLVREAFWNVYRPGCYEHLIIHNMRHDSSFISQLDYVIEKDNKIIAQIAYSTNDICLDGENTETVVTLGPVCVHPDYQRRGFGTKIIEYTLEKAKEMDIPYVFTIGAEDFYNRFGFEDASKYGVQFNDVEGETPFFMIKVLTEDKIDCINGTYKDNECFNVDKDELESFDKNFPPKKKEKREGQLDF
ncbi:MAG: N-acetyltransferase [Methanosphaera stadtmanae]|nr:N-acetyltransferase [Methanosphaera stadtmanae]